MPSTAKTSLSDQLLALGKGLSNFWMAPYCPAAGTTTAGIRRRAKLSGRRAMEIHSAAEAAGDEKTARAAAKLAKELVPYVSARLISRAFVRRAAQVEDAGR